MDPPPGKEKLVYCSGRVLIALRVADKTEILHVCSLVTTFQLEEEKGGNGSVPEEDPGFNTRRLHFKGSSNGRCEITPPETFESHCQSEQPVLTSLVWWSDAV